MKRIIPFLLALFLAVCGYQPHEMYGDKRYDDQKRNKNDAHVARGRFQKVKKVPHFGQTERIHAQHFGRGDGRFVVRSRCRTVCDICGRAVIGRPFADHMRDDFVVISRIKRDDRARFQRTVVGDRLGKNDIARLKSVLHRIGHNDVHPVPENRAVLLVHRRYGNDRKQHDEHRKRHDQNSQDCGQDRKNFFNFIRQIALP